MLQNSLSCSFFHQKLPMMNFCCCLMIKIPTVEFGGPWGPPRSSSGAHGAPYLYPAGDPGPPTFTQKGPMGPPTVGFPSEFFFRRHSRRNFFSASRSSSGDLFFTFLNISFYFQLYTFILQQYTFILSLYTFILSLYTFIFC